MPLFQDTQEKYTVENDNSQQKTASQTCQPPVKPEESFLLHYFYFLEYHQHEFWNETIETDFTLE